MATFAERYPQAQQRMDLLQLLIKKEVTLKYKRAYLGILWSLLHPIILSFVLYLAFIKFMRFPIKSYTLFFLAALFPWNWFALSVQMATVSLTGDIHLIKRVLFPRHYLIIATVAGQLVNMLCALPIIVVLVFIYGRPITWTWVWGIPLLLVLQFVLTLGMGLMLSMLHAFFRDMEHLVAVVINLMFWLTPIVYPLKQIPKEYRVYLALNPLTYLISAWRELFMEGRLQWSHLAISAVSAVVFLLLGIFTFRRLGRRLDEVL